MGSMVIDLSNVQANIGTFPNGVYEAQILEAKLDVAKSGDPMIVLQFELYHPDLGTASLRDWLPYKFPQKVKAFWQAINDLSNEDMQDPANQQVEIDPDDLVGQHLLVQLGFQEPKKGEPVPETRYKSVVGAWYFPASRVDLVAYEDTPF